jgi:hypothetical protein
MAIRQTASLTTPLDSDVFVASIVEPLLRHLEAIPNLVILTVLGFDPVGSGNTVQSSKRSGAGVDWLSLAEKRTQHPNTKTSRAT